MNIPLILVVALTIGGVVFGVMTLIGGGDPGLRPVDADSRARLLPGDRPLVESDVSKTRFDLIWRGYRMDQVDQTLRRLAYDIGYKSELIQVLEAEIIALREGRLEDADTLADARAASLDPGRRGEMPAEDEAQPQEATTVEPADDVDPVDVSTVAVPADELLEPDDDDIDTETDMATERAQPKSGVA
jgi:DivIVA domain-containing protein